MSQPAPKVSIAVPVRNGSRFLAQALDSILSQTFGDLEVIICDNASTDSSEQIAREYVARDPRVRYHRNTDDLGPAENFNVGLRLARGEYFKWHAHDDMISPQFIEKCVQALEADPTVAIAMTRVEVVDESGKLIENWDHWFEFDNADANCRWAAYVLVNHRNHRAAEIFGLQRMSFARQVAAQGAYARGDSVYLAKMALRGRIVQLPERLFQNRWHTSQSMQTLPSEARRNVSWIRRKLGTGPLPPPEWWDRSRKGKINFPEWRLFKEYWKAITPSPLTTSQKLRCRMTMMKWLLLNPHKLARDVIYAMEKLVLRIAAGGKQGDSTVARAQAMQGKSA